MRIAVPPTGPLVLRSQTAGACRYPGGMSEELRSHTIWDQEWEPALEEPSSRRLRELLGAQGCSKVQMYSDGGSYPATMDLAAGAACRTITSADDVTRLCQEGADADAALEVHLASRRVPPVGLLSLVIIDAIIIRNTDTRLTLPLWPSRELQQAVLEALIDAGADANRRPGEGFRPLPAARSRANATAVDALLRAGAVTQGMYLAFLPNQPYLPSPPCPQYEADLLKAYRRLLQHDPTLASEEFRDGEHTLTPIHTSGMAEGLMSAEFLRSFLTLLAEHGVSITARNGDSYTPLGSAVLAGAPCVVEWLCQRLGREETNKRQHTDAEGISLLEYAGHFLSCHLRDKAAQETVDRARQVIRTLLRHGADIQLMGTTTPHRRFVRKLVQDIGKEMNQPSAPPQQQQKQQQQQQQESGAAKAAKIAAKLIREEAREKVKKAKRGGKKGGKGGGHPQQHEQQQHGQQQQSVSMECEVVDDEGPSSVATGEVETDADEQPPSTSSADPQSAAPSPSCDVSSAVPAPATSPVDREDSDGEFVPVVRGLLVVGLSHLVLYGGLLPAVGWALTYPPKHAHTAAPRLSSRWLLCGRRSAPRHCPPDHSTPLPAGLCAHSPHLCVRVPIDQQHRPAAMTPTQHWHTGRPYRPAAAHTQRMDREGAVAGHRADLGRPLMVLPSIWLAQATSASSSSVDEVLLCDVCMDNYKSILLIPCRHICLCGGCAGVLMSGPPADRSCPRCRQHITDTQQVYL
ncbi:unnamed protein product [Vitrella brassicaformis CCMP3155]|uniref:RING-type domain-containing protein n=1 Tax=Vitrella brassicaformis (strain CCMP3155) TaxID=1169540 RepID=A0A0G4FTR4_VITBC|nr:unnamed protein product [Vitrella brassicaformis CCMP3155]|eukprot:CEM18340.1 unnamed protein product [Vitrella brassicaformis CCMP3155]